MSSSKTKTPVDLAIGVIRKWKETYKWVPIFGAVTAIAMAFSVGANNLPASFSTPVGSGALTLLQASVAACVIYVPGAAFASNSTVSDLFSDFIKESQPNEGFLMWSMVVVLITATLWLVVATWFELPVSSQQSIQGALLGTMLVTEGFSFMPLWNKNENHNFNGGGLLWIFLEWTVAPIIACIFAFLLFTVLKSSLLRHENAEKRMLFFLPLYYGIAAGMLCLFVVYQVLPNFADVYKWTTIVAIAVATLIGALLSLVIEYDRHTLIRHALAEKFDEMEDFFGFPQLLASCIFALIQSASEVAAVVSPFGAILDVYLHRAKYSGKGQDVGSLEVKWWFRAIGGLSASMGFFLCGWRLTQCLGGKLTYVSNSRGMASQMSAVATMIMLTRLNLPVSSVLASVGSLVGVGLADDHRVMFSILASPSFLTFQWSKSMFALTPSGGFGIVFSPDEQH